MTRHEAKRLLTEKGCKVGWVDRRTDLDKEQRYTLGVTYGEWILRTGGPTVQAAYDAMLNQIVTVDAAPEGDEDIDRGNYG